MVIPKFVIFKFANSDFREALRFIDCNSRDRISPRYIISIFHWPLWSSFSNWLQRWRSSSTNSWCHQTWHLCTSRISSPTYKKLLIDVSVTSTSPGNRHSPRSILPIPYRLAEGRVKSKLAKYGNVSAGYEVLQFVLETSGGFHPFAIYIIPEESRDLCWGNKWNFSLYFVLLLRQTIILYCYG